MHNLFIVTFIVFSTLFFGCNGDNPGGIDDTDFDTITDISYNDHVQPILNRYREILTANAILPPGLQMDSWDNLIKGWERGEVIIPFDSDNSLLIELTTRLENDDELRGDMLRLLQRWVDQGAPNASGRIPYADATDLLFVCSQFSAIVAVIDVDAKLVIRNIKLEDLGFSFNSLPHHVAVEPDGSSFYVSLIGADKILKFDDSFELQDEVNTPIPALLAAHPTNGLLYASRFPQQGGNLPQRIGVIDRATMEPFAPAPEIPTRPNPHAMAVDNSGDFVYTCSILESELIVIDAAQNEVTEIIDLGVGTSPLQLAVSPDDNTLIISNTITHEMVVVDVTDPNNRRITGRIPVNQQPWHPTFTPDGNRVYVGNFAANTVSVIDVMSETVQVIGDGSGQDGLSQPHGIAITDDGTTLFVSNRNVASNYMPFYDFGDNANNGTVVVINTGSNTIEKIIEIEDFGSGMAIVQP